MADLPLISIALCTYDGERYLREQLDSLLAQDWPRLEIVAVDDASRDATPAILADYAARDPRIRVDRNPVNLGFSANFERTLRLCRGELVAPCDQDDVWHPGKLTALQRALGGRAAAYCDSELVDEAGRSLGRRLSEKLRMAPVDDPAAFLFSNCISGHALLLRRALLDRALPIPEGVFHDWWLGFAAACAGGIAYCPEPLVRYRQHGRSVTDIAGRRRVAHAERPLGFRRAAVEATERRLRAFAAHPDAPRPELLREVLAGWLDWRGRWLAPGLAALLVRHRHAVFAMKHDVRARRLRSALGLLWGLRLKRLLGPHAYGAPRR